MSWWSSVVDGVKAVGTGFSNGARWAWNNASLSTITVGFFRYTANTTFQILEQGLALRTAIPTLVNNESARKIVSGAAYIVVNDVLPMILLNSANNSVQNYFREGYEEDAWLTPYSVFLSALTLVNYGVRAYTLRQGAQNLVRITILDSVGPLAFNSNKTTIPPSLCTELDCNFKRKMKGIGREPVLLLANDAVTYAVSTIPYGGYAASRVLRVLFNGRYITRLVTPERCERHKQMDSASVLALGLTYEASTMLMDRVLESTVGIPPFIYYRTLRHLVLLWHINVAAHMKIPLAKEGGEDLIDGFERICRFGADVLIGGLMRRIPIDFKPVEGAPPLIPLSPTLQLGTRLLNSDIEREGKKAPGLIRTVYARIAPPALKSGYSFINDPIVAMYWPGIQQGSLFAVETLLSYRESKIKSTLNWIPPKGLSLIINLKFGVPKKITEFAIMLSKEEDFWDFLEALKLWLERNKVSTKVTLVQSQGVALLGDKKLEPLPLMLDDRPSLPVAQLEPIKKQDTPVHSAEELKPAASRITPARTAQSLFTRRPRRRAGATEDDAPVEEAVNTL